MLGVRRLLCVVPLSVTIVMAASACLETIPLRESPPSPLPLAALARPSSPLPLPPPSASSLDSPTEGQVVASQSTPEEGTRKSPLEDVFFDYNKSAVRDDARTSLQKDAEWLKKWSSTKVTVEGHCDSRGSSEYNLALGARRATATKDYLVSLGVPSSRVAVVSKGKEQPFCHEDDVVDQLEPPYPMCVACHIERCWQENRRGHFIVTAK
jgi:peptidoglycan-associated lipoprotein